MIAGLSFFDLGLVLGLLAVLFFCGWAFWRTLKAEFCGPPFEAHESREWLAQAHAKKPALAARHVRL
mgnify:CR=1 FL=1